MREPWADDVNYYTANLGARSLIVVFCCGANGVGVPTAYFLQMLRDDLYDVLVLYDRRRLHFDHGIEGFSKSFMETMCRIEEFAKARAFDEIITFGVSMGGFPALRAGLVLGADRAISVGGVYVWPVARLLKQRRTPRPFDLLCPCFTDRKVELVAVTPARCESDVKHLNTLQRTFPQVHAVMIDTERHNVMG